MGKIFQTSKGSVYHIHGPKTRRFKAYRREHGVMEQGEQPCSDVTVYMNIEDAKRLCVYVIAKYCHNDRLDDETYNKRIAIGDLNDTITVDSVSAQISIVPKIGLVPVEMFELGRKLHFGNTIVSIEDSD